MILISPLLLLSLLIRSIWQGALPWLCFMHAAEKASAEALCYVLFVLSCTATVSGLAFLPALYALDSMWQLRSASWKCPACNVVHQAWHILLTGKISNLRMVISNACTSCSQSLWLASGIHGADHVRRYKKKAWIMYLYAWKVSKDCWDFRKL